MPELHRRLLADVIALGNDLLHTLVGDGFANQQHSAAFLWWAKDQPGGFQ